MSDGPRGSRRGSRRNALLVWLIVLILAGLSIRQALVGSYRWGFITWLAILLVIVPAGALRNPMALPPWELFALVAIPVIDAVLLGETIISPIAIYLAVAAVALIVVVDLDAFTDVRMHTPFAVALVVIATLAVAASWNVAQWLADLALGTDYIVGDRGQDEANRAMMIDFAYATAAGLIAGGLFMGYLRNSTFAPTGSGSEQHDDGEEPPDPTPSLTERIGLDDRRVRMVSWGMQLLLGGLLVFGLVTRDVPTITNAGIALAVSFLPALVAHNLRLPIEPELVVWLLLAVLLHSLGSAGLYGFIEQWDSLTHSLSASLVAAAGYTVVRTIDLHSDRVYLPQRMMFVFILLFVLAVGVVWELAEFGVDGVAQQLEMEAALAQHGIDDTIGDLMFNVAGAIVAATIGGAYLHGVSHQLASQWEDRGSGG